MNVGGLSFTYGLETDDTIGSSYVFNAHDAAWITFCRGLFDAAQVMYRNRESAGCFNTTNFLAKAKAYQETRPERVWVADAQRKYLRPYEDNGTETYLPMLAGKKTHQRAQVKTYNAYYYASKYVSDLCTSQNIMVRGNTPTSGASIIAVPPANKATLSMYINCYIVVASTSYNVVAKTKAVCGQTYEMDFSTIGSMGETELYFCSAPMITGLGGLAQLYFKQNNFAMGTNLQRLEIGSNVTGYENPNLEGLTIGNNKMLEYLDVRNCPNATGALDLSGCVSLSEVYLENTGFTGISFATGGLLTIAHLPSPTSITMRELIYLTDLKIESAANISTLRIEDCDFASTATLTIGSAAATTQATKDIVLNLVDSSPNLSRVRLVGIDWNLPNETVLNRLLAMAGIDGNSYDIAQSVLTGEAYVPTIRSGLYNLYREAWAYLNVTYSTMIPQYLATFVNANGDAILDKNGNAYTQWVDSGSSPYDPITMGYEITVSDAGSPTAMEYDSSSYSGDYYLDTLNGVVYVSDGTSWVVEAVCDILTPTLTPTAQYNYTFTRWDDMSVMSTARTINAEYSTTTRTYTVTWWKNLSTSLEIQTDIPYGSAVTYSGDIPQNTADESTLSYHLFKGWDKSTGRIVGDTNVYALWDDSGLPASSVDMSAMTPVQIYGVCQAGFQSQYFEDLDYTEITLGHDFNFSNVESCEIGNDVMLTGVPRDRFVSGGYYFDGNTTYTTNIKLFEEDSPAFTMVIDFQFSRNVSGETLVSGNDGNTAIFRLVTDGTGAMIYWGDQSVRIGYSKFRDIVAIRHPKGSRYLYVYAAENQGSSMFADSVTKTTLLSSTLPTTSVGLSFGGVKYDSGYRDVAAGHVHWCKIWYDDIGEECAYDLAAWPREKIRMEYWGVGKYYYSGTSTKSKASFICNSQVGGLTGRGYYMNSSNINSGGWDSSKMRTFLNARILKALPKEWQAMIKTVEIKATKGNQSILTQVSDDKIYLPSYYELGGSGTGYNDEIGADSQSPRIPWFTGNQQRIKFRGKTRKYSGDSSLTIYTASQDPAALYQTDIEPGTIWINSGNSSAGYIFVSQDELDEYGITASIAADSDYANGGWCSATNWWERSPSIASTTYFNLAITTGGVGSGGGAGGIFGVVLGFSI